jgi:hypothetical protein
MKSIMAPLACVAFTTAVIADPLARQYAAEIVRQNVKVPDTELEFTEWQQSVPGGYVLRFAFDADGDGSAERFLASSFNAEKLVCEWTVYAGASGKLLGKGTSLRPDGFWWNPTTHEMLDYVRFGAEGGSAIFSQFSTNGLTTRSEAAALDEVSSGLGSKEAPRQGFQRIKPDVTISLLADVVADADSGWRPLILDDAGHNYSLPNGRLLLTEDAPRVESLRSFTPKAAFAALQKSEPQSEKSSNKPPVTSTLPIVRPAPPPNASAAKPVAASEEPTSSTSWSIIVVLIVAALGLLWLVLKRRS